METAWTDAEIATPRVATSQRFGTVRSRKLLLVEDDEMLRRGILRRLRHQGYDVYEAGNLMEAKLMASKVVHLDLVLSDYNLPDGTGLDLLSWLNDDTDLKPAFVLMSGDFVSTQNVLGDFLFLAKPFSFSQLEELLDRSYLLHTT